MRINPRTLTATVKIKQVEITSQTKAIPTTTVVGELINNCANPTDMNMRITLRDGNGKVVSVDDQWCSAPNTPHNTPAGESCTFKNTQMVYGVTSVDFKLIEVRQWSERFIKSMKSGIEKN